MLGNKSMYFVTIVTFKELIVNKKVETILCNCKEHMNNTISDWEKAIAAFQKIWTPRINEDIQNAILDLEYYHGIYKRKGMIE